MYSSFEELRWISLCEIYLHGQPSLAPNNKYLHANNTLLHYVFL